MSEKQFAATMVLIVLIGTVLVIFGARNTTQTAQIVPPPVPCKCAPCPDCECDYLDTPTPPPFIPTRTHTPAPSPTLTSTPPPTFTPTPTITPTPVLTQDGIALMPPYSLISVTELVTISVFAKYRAQALEIKLSYNPVVLKLDWVFYKSCDVEAKVTLQPGIVRYQCEYSQDTTVDEQIIELVFVGHYPGVSNVIPYVDAVFIGYGSGFGGYLPSKTVVIEVRQ